MIRHAMAVFVAALLVPVAVAAQVVKEPWPAFLSAEARAGLAANDARPPEPPAVEGRRRRADAIQQEIGAPRLARYGVMMKDDAIAGVPVRVFTPAKGKAKGRFSSTCMAAASSSNQSREPAPRSR